MDERMSLLMSDSSTGDSNKETMLDFILSWTLRRAQSCYSNEKPMLYRYCREILFNLLEINNLNGIEVESVETWKQWERIDLHANIQLRMSDGSKQYHTLLVENKVYTMTREGQLAKYKKLFTETYKDTEYAGHMHFVLITCFESTDSPSRILEADCEKNGYRFDQYIVGRHHDKDDKNPHFHLMANVVLNDGTRANLANIGKAAKEASISVTEQWHLTPANHRKNMPVS